MRVDVVVPAYNASAYIGETLEAILAQDRPHGINTVIVVDDGSIDSTGDIVRAHGAPVHLVRANRIGNVEARNMALRHSDAELIAFCDADDVWEPTKMAQQISAFADPSVVASCTALHQIDPVGRILTTKGSRWTEDTIRQLLLDEFVMPTPLSSWVVRREALNEFDAGLPVGADLELASRLIRAGRVHYLQEPLIRYRIHGTSISAARTADQQLVRRYLRGAYGAATGASFATWRKDYQPSRRDRREDAAVYHYRAAGQRLSEGSRGPAVYHLVASGLFDPREFFRKVKALY